MSTGTASQSVPPGTASQSVPPGTALNSVPPGTDQDGVLTVLVSGRTVSLPAGDVTEIVRTRPLTRVPNAPPGLLGLANLRGTVLPVVSLATLLGDQPVAPSRSQRVVVAGRGERVGFLVDAVTNLSSEGDADALDLNALLARHFTAPIRRPTTQAAALSPAPAAVEADDVALVTLRVCGQDYALGLDQVSAILKLPADVSQVAGEGDAILGVIPFQGEILPLVSLAALLGLPPEPEPMLRIAVVPLGGIRVGLVSAGLDRVLRVPRRAIGPVPAILSRGRGETRLEGICHIDGGRVGDGRLISLLAPEGLFDEATTRRIIAQAAQGGVQVPEQQASGQEQFVVFVLGGERYGLPIAAVDEVVRRPASLTRVPRTPAFVEGVMNLRGRVVPVINQASRFAAAARPGGRVIIVTIGGLQAGFAVDAVTAILTVDADTLQPAPGLSAGQGDVFDRVVLEDGGLEDGGAMTLLIDAAALLDQVERDLLAAITPGSRAA